MRNLAPCNRSDDDTFPRFFLRLAVSVKSLMDGRSGEGIAWLSSTPRAAGRFTRLSVDEVDEMALPRPFLRRGRRGASAAVSMTVEGTGATSSTTSQLRVATKPGLLEGDDDGNDCRLGIFAGCSIAAEVTVEGSKDGCLYTYPQRQLSSCPCAVAA